MLKETKILTRAQLYDFVWKTPMFELAKQFQISDNGLRKVCRKYIIPFPKMGYWQKVKFGKVPKKPSLPDYQGEDKILIKMMPRIKEMLKPSQIISEAINIPENISKFHPLIKQTKDLFKAGHKDQGRFRSRRGERALDIRVGPEQLTRAFRIMDTIIKALEERGARVTLEREGEWKTSTCVNIDGEKVEFSLEESLKIVKISPDKNNYMSQEFVPKGTLRLCIKNYLSGCQTKWSDGKEKIELKLASFLNGLWFAAAYLKKENEEWAAKKKRDEEDQLERQRKLLLIEEEKKQIQGLEQQAQTWQKSRLIKAFIRASIKIKGAHGPDGDFERWVSWASSYADRIDPLKELPA